MPVDVIEHLLPGMEQRVQRADTLMSHDDAALPIDVGMDTERSQQPLNVDTAVGDIAGASIARQIIELVYIERPAQEVA